ncbi:hypothetical protein JCM10207_003476 [Rhodosporidiobolus poonsookiae]
MDLYGHAPPPHAAPAAPAPAADHDQLESTSAAQERHEAYRVKQEQVEEAQIDSALAMLSYGGDGDETLRDMLDDGEANEAPDTTQPDPSAPQPFLPIASSSSSVSSAQPTPDPSSLTFPPSVWGALRLVAAPPAALAPPPSGLDCATQQTQYRIGRDASCHLCIPAKAVSKVHATLKISSKTGKVWLTDSSRNGTFVNNDKLEAGQKKPLQNGDQLCFGSRATGAHYTFFRPAQPPSLALALASSSAPPTPSGALAPSPGHTAAGVVRNYWTAADDAALREGRIQGKTMRAIALELDRTEGAVSQRFLKYRNQWTEQGLLPATFARAAPRTSDAASLPGAGAAPPSPSASSSPAPAPAPARETLVVLEHTRARAAAVEKGAPSLETARRGMRAFLRGWEEGWGSGDEGEGGDGAERGMGA